MATARLHLLGTPLLTRGAERWVLPLERRSQLLVLLALDGGWVARREVASRLWPDAAPPLASTSLRKTLFRLSALPWGDCVQGDGGALRFDGDTDAAAFEAALRDDRLDDGLALWRGEPLAGYDDDALPAWTEQLRARRQRWQAAWRGAALRWLDGEVAAPAALTLAARLLEADPWDEAALQQQLRWLQRSGQHEPARQLHAAFVERLRTELGVEPGAALRAWADDADAGRRRTAAAVREAPREGGAVDADFVGRAAELRGIASRMAADGVRLVTLLGPGGVGKTRLARRALQELAPGFADGGRLVPLDDLGAASEVAPRLARELGLPPDSGDADARARQHLRSRRMLLVLDNAEQVEGLAAWLDTLLQDSPGLKLLVTSRVRLGLACEEPIVLDGLPCPDAEDVDALESFDAARLFVRCAQRVDPRFRASTEGAAVAEICRLVGGLPLALELAAAWVRLLPAGSIVAELRRSVELLAASGGAASGRHAGIDRVFEQSWRLLGTAERDALARLSVLRGSFSAEAARAVTGAAAPVLGALADKSLLHHDGTRLHLHPLVQQLAAQRLAASGTAEAAADAHARHYLALLARLAPALRQGGREALQQLDLDFENGRAAWLHALRRGDAAALVRSAEAMTDYGDLRRRVAEVLDLHRQALDGDACRAPAMRAPLLATAAHLQYRLDRYDDAQALAREALALAERSGAVDVLAQALNTLGSCALQQGRLDDAERHWTRHLEQFAPDADPMRAARTLSHLAMVDKVAGRPERALQRHTEALQLQQRFGDTTGEVTSLQNMALLHLSRAEAGPAQARLQQALALCDRHGYSGLRAPVLGALVDHARLVGDHAAAHRYASEAMELARALDMRGLVCGLAVDFTHLALHRGDAAEAAFAVAEAAGLALALGRPSLRRMVGTVFAEWLDAEGARAEAGVARARLDAPALLAQLLQRVAIEAPVAFAPLRAELGRAAADA